MDELFIKHPAAQKLGDDCTIHGPSYIPDQILIEVMAVSKYANQFANQFANQYANWQFPNQFANQSGLVNSKSVGSDLCKSFERFVRILATGNVDQLGVREFVLFCLVPLEKNPGIWPIGIGETLKRIAVLEEHLWKPTKMFVNGTNQHKLSAGGATQGCNLAMGFYGVGIMELIYILKQQVPKLSAKSVGMLMTLLVLGKLNM
ncbi:hypothetical protein ACHWQZ_G000586 [Mnemiopsis leidyi]